MGFFDTLKEKFQSKDNFEVPDAGDEGYVELTPENAQTNKSKITVRPFVIEEFEDVKPVLDSLREGYTISLINIKPLERFFYHLAGLFSAVDIRGHAFGGNVNLIARICHLFQCDSEDIFARITTVPRSGVEIVYAFFVCMEQQIGVFIVRPGSIEPHPAETDRADLCTRFAVFIVNHLYQLPLLSYFADIL